MTHTDVTTTAFAVEIVATTEIDAPAERVWAVLAATAEYPEWNPFVRALRGPLTVGERIEVELKLPGRAVQKMTPTIVAVEPGRSFEWLGRIGLPRVFDGRHRFTVEPVDAGRSRLVQSERLSGLLIPAFRSMLTGATPEAFTAMNDAIAKRALDA
jgi:hypothetical protein